MLGWDEELTELTPQRRKERERQEQEKKEEDCVRGRRVLLGILILYIGIQIVSKALGFYSALNENKAVGYVFQTIIQVILIVVLVRGLWRGREWARVFFAIVMVLGMLYGGKEVVKLIFIRESSQAFTWGVYEDTLELDAGYGTKSVFDYEKEARARYKEWEEERARYRKRKVAAHFGDIVICAGWLYVLYGYNPVKVFFDCQAER
ncbi:MAG: hypothetical protein K2N63_10640 [Lachnospiraceae bacterium]|nr:hypothetical protein [Lachnospiraceae bacterium]